MLRRINIGIIIRVLSLIISLDLLLPSITGFAVGSHIPRDSEFGYRLLGVILIVFAASVWNCVRRKKIFK